MDREQLRLTLAQQNKAILTGIKQSEIDALVSAIIQANRIYVAGWGRAGTSSGFFP